MYSVSAIKEIRNTTAATSYLLLHTGTRIAAASNSNILDLLLPRGAQHLKWRYIRIVSAALYTKR